MGALASSINAPGEAAQQRSSSDEGGNDWVMLSPSRAVITGSSRSTSEEDDQQLTRAYPARDNATSAVPHPPAYDDIEVVFKDIRRSVSKAPRVGQEAPSPASARRDPTYEDPFDN